MFKKKKKPINSEEYIELKKKIAILEIDISLITDRLTKAITRKAIRKPTETEEMTDENSLNTQIIAI